MDYIKKSEDEILLKDVPFVNDNHLNARLAEYKFDLKLRRQADKIYFEMSLGENGERTTISMTTRDKSVGDMSLKRLANKVMENIRQPQNMNLKEFEEKFIMNDSYLDEFRKLGHTVSVLKKDYFNPIVEDKTFRDKKDLEFMTVPELQDRLINIDVAKSNLDICKEELKKTLDFETEDFSRVVKKAVDSEKNRLVRKEYRNSMFSESKGLRRITRRAMRHPGRALRLGWRNIRTTGNIMTRPAVDRFGGYKTELSKPIVKSTVDKQFAEMFTQLNNEIEESKEVVRKQLNYRGKHPNIYLEKGQRVELVVKRSLDRETYKGLNATLTEREKDERYNDHYKGQTAFDIMKKPPVRGTEYELRIYDETDALVKAYSDWREIKTIRPYEEGEKERFGKRLMDESMIKAAEENVQKYVNEHEAQAFTAVKSGKILFREVQEGEKIPVYTKNGNLESEEVGKAGNFLVTRCDDNGKPVLDKHGHTNSWQMDGETLNKKYRVNGSLGIASPKGAPQKFITVDKDIVLYKPWGKNGEMVPQSIKAGGVLNITDKKDIYGIAKEEFGETYKVVPTAYDIVVENKNGQSMEKSGLKL